MISTNWGVHVSFRTGECVYLMVGSREDAEDVVKSWVHAVKEKHVMLHLRTATGLLNVCLTDQVVKMTVVDQEMQDRVMVETVRHRRRLEEEASLPDENDY